MAVPVNVYVHDGAVSPRPVVGVVVGVFDPSTFQQISASLTDGAGRAALLLPGGDYEVRGFKNGYVLGGPRLVTVNEPTDPESPNGFEIVAIPIGPAGVPADPRLCRCVGRFLGPSNQPIRNSLVRISQQADVMLKQPKIVDGNLISGEALEARTDRNGYVSIDLLRGGAYWVTFAGESDDTWNILVPDRPSANLIDLIHPAPASLVYSPAGDFSLRVGDLRSLKTALIFSDYEEFTDGLTRWISFESSDPTVVDVTFHGNGVVVLARSPGSAQITATVRDNLTPVRVPPAFFASTPLNVSVLP